MDKEQSSPDSALQPGDASDRRTRNREARRDRVYASAVELFIEQGFENTTMEQIAHRADVARATVFNHFPRKTAFLDEWTMRRRKRAAQAVSSHDVSDWTLERILRRYMVEMARLSVESRRETVALMTAAVHATDLLAHPALAGELAQYVAAAQQARQARRGIDAHQSALVVATSYFAVLTQWISEDPAPFDLEAELQAMLDIVLFGVLQPSVAGQDGAPRARTTTGRSRSAKR